MGLPEDHPAFQQVVAARWLVARPDVSFSTREARSMLSGCLAIIDQQQRAVLQWERSIWDGGKRWGWRYGIATGLITGLIVGLVLGWSRG